MRDNRIDDERDQDQEREPSGAPSLAFEAGFLLACFAAAFLLYGKPRLVDLILGWIV